MFEEKSYEAHKDHKKLYDTLEKSLERDYSDQLLSDLDEARQKKRKRRDVPKTPFGSPWPQPPPPPPSAGASGTQAYETPDENSLLAKTGDMTNILNWYCRHVNKTVLTPADLEGQAYEIKLTGRIEKEIKSELMSTDHCLFMVLQVMLLLKHNSSSKKDLEYLRYGSKGSSLTLLISKMKAANYPDFGLKLLVPEQMWIDDVENFQLGIKSYQTQLNLTKLGWDATGDEFKHDYTIIESP
nr:hypothetical protein [Tanacetum cinerariifolium]